MYNENEIIKIQSIKKKLDDIFLIIDRHNGIVKALKDLEGQPAILMLLVACAEQFNKLKKENAKILEIFDESDIKGIIDVRNFIAHDYDGINLSIIEDGLRYEIPKIIKTIKKVLENKI